MKLLVAYTLWAMIQTLVNDVHMSRCFEESEPPSHQLRSFIYAVDDYFKKLQYVLMAYLLIKFHSQLHLYETPSVLFHQTRSQVSKQCIGGALDAAAATTDNAPPSSSHKKKIKPFDSDIAGSNPKPEPDIGILFRKQCTRSRRLAVTCPREPIGCVNGYSVDETCQDEYNEKG